MPHNLAMPNRPFLPPQRKCVTGQLYYLYGTHSDSSEPHLMPKLTMRTTPIKRIVAMQLITTGRLVSTGLRCSKRESTAQENPSMITETANQNEVLNHSRIPICDQELRMLAVNVAAASNSRLKQRLK